MSPQQITTVRSATWPLSQNANLNMKQTRLSRLPLGLKNELVSFIGEFCGTFMFLLLAFLSTHVVVTENPPDQPLDSAGRLYVALAFGFSLAANVWIFYRISGGLFNPAVTLGLLLAGAIKPLRSVVLLIAQLVAGIAAAALADGLSPGPLNVSTKVAEGVSDVRALFIEFFLTAQLVLAVLVLAVEKHKATFLAPVGIGLALFVIHLAAIPYDGCSVNPARSLGPEVVSGFQSYDWIFYVGPFLGSLLAVGLYKLLKLMVYETANPGQDFDELETAMFVRHEKASTRDQVLRPVISYPRGSQSFASQRLPSDLNGKESMDENACRGYSAHESPRETQTV
ncbi:uncharacterized protein PV09_06840 [Verruconis gallopava]|uniref:Aquaporin n=1 Tax=Verruconis gallopava TaxID=253628 RepID=A0A0D2A565_9PEZI|nr:uncharacterized protein PV09_06840 [Verruconis gallopava]KIW01655.1 hypothetical protein PV09_06840 [Verruconis gallopava]